MLNKVREVFTREYREETNYRGLASKMLCRFRLKNTSESVEVKVKRLSDKSFVSEFKVNVGEY